MTYMIPDFWERMLSSPAKKTTGYTNDGTNRASLEDSEQNGAGVFDYQNFARKSAARLLSETESETVGERNAFVDRSNRARSTELDNNENSSSELKFFFFFLLNYIF
uniref:Uncharacterized protein n=1 Tax=Cacopsylla melanoneura TaxID=428564 RepID=A0A8D9AGI5_9HEMI